MSKRGSRNPRKRFKKTKMSEEITKVIRILPFSGKQSDWRMWSKKFLARAKIQGYKDVLTMKVTLSNTVTVGSIIDADVKSEEEKKLSYNEAAYNDLLLSCQDEVSFGAVEQAVSEEFPDGNCQQAWQNLMSRYEPRTAATKVELKKKFADSRLSIGADPDEWITDLELIRQQLLNLKYKMSDEDLIIHILNNMTKEYENLVERLETKVDVLNITQLKTEIRQKYQRIKKYNEGHGDEEKVLAAYKPNKFKGNCTYCGKPGHSENYCFQKKNNQPKNNNYGMKNKKYCSFCKKTNHNTVDCFLKANKKKGTQAFPAQEVHKSDVAEITLMAGTEIQEGHMSKDFYVADTGSSAHVTNSTVGLVNVREVYHEIMVGDGTTLKSSLIGDKILRYKTPEGKSIRIVLQNVKYSPDMCTNLFSLLTVVDNGWKLYNDGKKIVIEKDSIKVVFGTVIPSGSGFIVGTELVPDITHDKSLINFLDLHEKFGHPADSKLKATATKYGIKLDAKTTDCVPCLRAKLRMTSVPKVTSVVSEVGERFSIDISSVRNLSLGGRKYWLLIVDHCTGYKHSRFLHYKSDLPYECLQYFKKLRVQGFPVKYIRCDNAGENKSLEKLLIENSFNVTMEYTPPYNPQYNGIVERAFATLYGRVRAMLNGAGLEPKLRVGLWAEAAHTATVLDNITVNEKKGKSPYEMFYKKKSKLITGNHLRTFGEKGLMANPTNIKSKLQNRGKEVLFLGYTDCHSTDVYRVFFLATQRAKLTRNVRWIRNNVKKQYECTTVDVLNSDVEMHLEQNYPEAKEASTVLENTVDENKTTVNQDLTLEQEARKGDIKLQGELKRLNTFYNPTEKYAKRDGPTTRSRSLLSTEDVSYYCRTNDTKALVVIQ